MSREFDFSTRYARMSDTPFILAAARAFYVDSWMRQGPAGERPIPAGSEILDIAPQTQRWALQIATKFVKRLEERFNKKIDDLIVEWRIIWDSYKYSDRPSTDEMIGWYCAMESLGHGVGLFDFGIHVDLPRTEV